MLSWTFTYFILPVLNSPTVKTEFSLGHFENPNINPRIVLRNNAAMKAMNR
jgi:hypothetical protein